MSTKLRQRNVVEQPTKAAGKDAKKAKPTLGKSSESGSFCTLGVGTFLKMFFLLLIGAIIFYCTAPFVFRASSLIKNSVVFMNFFKFTLRTPEECGLRCTRNFLLDSPDHSVRLGVWHVPPEEKHCSGPEEVLNKSSADLFSDGRLVVLYTHGIGGTRSSSHRTELYKLLSNQLQAHIIAFDYRSYGDSSGWWPTSEGLVNDTATVYNWLLREGVSAKRILVWGHSLGTAVAVGFLSRVAPEYAPKAAVLEAPFTNLKEAIPEFPLAKLFSYLPYFEYCFVQPVVQDPMTNFDSISLLHKVQTPLLVLHAKDDRVVPFNLGYKLHSIAHQMQPTAVPRPKFHEFSANYRHGHKNIVQNPQLPSIIRKFIEEI